MIFAAGLGTRLRPLTLDRPKAMVEVNGRPLLGWKIDWLRQWGYRNLVVNVHHYADQIETYLRRDEFSDLEIAVSDERDLLLETGGGLKKAAPLLQNFEEILITNVDILTDMNLENFVEFHHSREGLATLVTRHRKSSRLLIFREDDSLTGWENIRTGEQKWSGKPGGKTFSLAFSGIHLIRRDMLGLIIEEGVFSIIDLYLRLAKENNIYAYLDDDSYWLDVGRPENIPEAEKLLSISS